LSILELIVILIISDAVQNSMVGDNATLWGGLVAVLTLLAMDLGLKALTGRSRRLRKAVEGEPRLLVRDGRLLDKALREEGWNRSRSARPSARTGSNGWKAFAWRSSRRTGPSPSSRCQSGRLGLHEGSSAGEIVAAANTSCNLRTAVLRRDPARQRVRHNRPNGTWDRALDHEYNTCSQGMSDD